MAAISTPEIRAFTAARQAAGASNGEINRELTALKRMFLAGRPGGEAPAQAVHPDAEGEQRPHRILRARGVRGTSVPGFPSPSRGS